MSENPNLPRSGTEIPELHLRRFSGESDYDSIAAVITGSSAADGIRRTVTAEDIAAVFEGDLSNCDPYTDIVFAEVNGDVVGYGRVWWSEELPSMRLYHHNAFLLSAYRRIGIGRILLIWMENRLQEIARSHPPALQKCLQVSVSQGEKDSANLLEQSGYQPVRYFYQMVRPNLDEIDNNPLPEGVELRPVKVEHYQAVWECMNETSGDEWGNRAPTEAAYQEWLAHPHFQPQLWQVAWDIAADKVVGTVLTFINHAENQQFGRKRGYTEGVGVSRQWRQRGLAKALISRSLQAQKAAGMSESALVVDSQSAFGATRLYESCGFQTVDRDTIYRKPFSLDGTYFSSTT